jgi:predicted TIM-barrel enzyme
MNREEALARLRAEVEQGSPVIGAGAGTGLSAKFAEAGGADLIIIYNSGRYRMAGRGSLAGLLPYGDANAIVMDMAREVLPVVAETPVLAGVCGTDPFRLMPVFLEEVKRAGFSGVQNFPSVGLMDGTFRAGLEETGMSYALEVDMIRHARELDLLTAPYVFPEDEVRKMADAGADVLVPHMGLTTGGSTVRRLASRSTRLSSASRRFVTQPCRPTPRSSASAIAGRSPSPTTPRRSSSARTAWSGSSARRAWSAFPPRWP